MNQTPTIRLEVADRKFSDLCLPYAGLKHVVPEHDGQMDLNDPFLTAPQPQ